MAGTKQENSSVVTLRGSAQLVKEFFYYGINSILYQRGIYPAETFICKQQYGLTVYTITDNEVKEYLNNVLTQIKDWLEAGKVQKLVLVMTNVDTKEVVERWEFNIEHEPGFGPQPSDGAKVGGKELKAIQKEMRAVICQITACVTFLPLLDCTCSFDLLVYTCQSVDVSDEWADSAPCFIANSQSIRLRSFSTSIHKVEGCVSYKADA